MLLIYLPIIIYSVILHELSHGYMADYLGDNTARKLGRLTLNPISHIDPILTVLLPLSLILIGSPFIFGGARPVPINPKKFKNFKIGMALTAIVGPFTNIIIALIASIALHTLPINVFAYRLLYFIITINIFLAVLNLLPIPPLDGSRIVGGILPENLSRQWFALDRYGLIFILLLFLSFNTILDNIIYPVTSYVLNFLINYPLQ